MSDEETKSGQANDKELLENHNYDGIRELNNPLPGWWLIIFYCTIIFSAGYYYYYEFGSGPSSDQELAEDLSQMNIQKNQAAESSPEYSAEDLKALVNDPNSIAAGSAEYASKCAVCHGDKGQGVIGPNLTDSAWKHGKGSFGDIVATIKQGVPDKGMPPWEGMIKPQLILQVAAYIRSLAGSQPPNAKGPEGVEYPQ